MKRFICIAFLIALALACHTQASANALDGTSWNTSVNLYYGFVYFSSPWYLGTFQLNFSFSGGLCAISEYYDGGWHLFDIVPYTEATGPNLTWTCMAGDLLFKGVVIGDMMYGAILFFPSGFIGYAFYGFPGTPPIPG